MEALDLDTNLWCRVTYDKLLDDPITPMWRFCFLVGFFCLNELAPLGRLESTSERVPYTWSSHYLRLVQLFVTQGTT